MSKPIVSLALALLPVGVIACVADNDRFSVADNQVPVVADAPTSDADASTVADAAIPVDAITADAASGEAICNPFMRIPRSTALESFPLFRRARARWTEALRLASGTKAPASRPSLLGPGDALTFDMWSQYVNADVWAGQPEGYHPFGVPPYVAVRGEEKRLAESSSLVLADDSAAQLVRLTDFSAANAAPRIAALCDAYAADAEELEAAPLVALCNDLGSIVGSHQVADLKVDGIKLVRAKECGLPSMAYGAFLSEGTDKPLAFDWPNFLDRDSEYRQPCVGVYLHVKASSRTQLLLGEGWLFVKAVPDLAKVPFPYRERDATHGNVAGRNGAPRGEFVSNRQIFTSGASLYLGTSPLWLLHRDQLGRFEDLVAAFDGPARACDLASATATPTTPCILPPQKPFLFPTSGSVVWLRQALDALHPLYQAGERNASELFVPTFFLGDVFADVLRFFASTRLDDLDRPALGQAAEQLGAMFHAFRLYGGRGDMQRLRTPLLSLGDGYFLGIPDQGYFPIGTPTPATLTRLESLDLSAALDLDRQRCSLQLFTFSDLISKE